MSNAAHQRNDASSVQTVNVAQGSTLEAALEQIRDALRGLRFGNISIVVQDGVVVQIERTEKKRLR